MKYQYTGKAFIRLVTYGVAITMAKEFPYPSIEQLDNINSVAGLITLMMQLMENIRAQFYSVLSV